MKFLPLLFIFVLQSIFSQQKGVDFIKIQASIEINPVKRNVIGNGNYTFTLIDKKIDTVRIDAQKMEFTEVKINGSKVKFKNNAKQLLLFDGFRKGENTLTFNYVAWPTQAMYFVNWDFTKEIDSPEKVNGQVWTQGQGKYTSNWLPSFDDVNEKVVFGLDVRFQKSFEVISNGVLLGKVESDDNFIWQYRMKQPMSSYLVAIAIGHFDKRQLDAASGIQLYQYYESEDKNRLEPTYRYSKEIFDFFENEIGVAYPWEVYRQIPVRDFLYAGMENTTATLFSHDFMIDETAFNDRNYVDVNAHELAHQWFGDLVTAKTGKDHWLQEGFATYYSLLAQKEVFGENYFYNKLYNSAQQLAEAAKTDLKPIFDEKASSLTFYQKGAWALHILQESIGREKFNLAVKNYLEKYKFQNVTTDDFLTEVANVSDFDTATYKKKWLESSEFPLAEAEKSLKKNAFIKYYIELRDQPLSATTDKNKILQIISGDDYYPIKQLLLYQNVAQPFEVKESILKTALQTNNIEVRQTVAATVETIPESFRVNYESLLNDQSYETQEIALFNLWKIFPEQRKKYIDLSKNWIGFQDKNLKLLYLSLAFATIEDQSEKVKIYRELISYTGTNYDSALQQDALQKLLNLKLITEDVLRSLAYGLGNHRWQFVKFAKDNIRILLKEKKNRELFLKIRKELPIREKTQLQRLLAE